MTSSRLRPDVGGSFSSRRGHASQLSISDPSHHVTEAIGTLYGDEDEDINNITNNINNLSTNNSLGNRPLSFMPSAQPEQLSKPSRLPNSPETGSLQDDARRPLSRSISDYSGSQPPANGGPGIKKSLTLSTRGSSQLSNSASNESGPKSPISPTLSLRDVKSESSQFPMTNIEDPSDIAQELSNLQALRRMSMDVGNNSDPDLLPFSSLSTIPSVAPSGGDDDGDPSRLLWVPAAVHPELAPTEFKNFLENRVQTMKRRSGDSSNSSLLSPEASESPGGGLQRKKSMLSRQIDNSGGRAADNYVDGAERLDSKRSSEQSTELSLDELVKDPTKAVQKLAHEAETGTEDRPILPAAPGMGLRRSTRTTYRKGGSLRSGERSSLKRTSGRKSQQEAESPSPDHPVPPLVEPPPGHSLTRVQSESAAADNYPRAGRAVRRQQKFSDQASWSALTGGEVGADEPESPGQNHAVEQVATSRPSTSSSEPRTPIPLIQESPIAEEEEDLMQQAGQAAKQYPQRSSSSQKGESVGQQSQMDDLSGRPNQRPSVGRSYSSSVLDAGQHHQMQTLQQQPHHGQTSHQQSQSYNDMSSQASPHPGAAGTSTDSLTFIPTLPAEEKRTDKKSKKDKDDDGASSSKSTGWSKWLKGSSSSDDGKKKKKEKEKEREREEEERKKGNKSFVEKAQDNVRLDVLQNSIESAVTKGRESLLLDRDNVDSKLADERKKDGNSRKSDPPAKKEKEGGLFSGLFGGNKKKADRESRSSKGHHLRVSEDPPYRPLRPDVDYHWTRFPLLEERAIYRMAHIKLANPRRSLASQVLLSNFMYNYLAIVQAMHPQVQVPQSPQQRRLEEERRRKEEEEQYLAQQQMHGDPSDQDALDQYDFDYHRGANQYGMHEGHQGVEYIDDAQIYEYDHGGGGQDPMMHGDAYSGQDAYGAQGGKDYYHAQYSPDQGGHGRHNGRDDMW